MIKEFYSQVLPSTGLYCVFTIDKVDNKKVRSHWVESIDTLEAKIEELKQADQYHVFVALSSFNKASRVAKEAKAVKSFFVDLDVGEGKGYPTKEEAIEALTTFVQDTQLPPPVRVDSGRGVHAYWILDTEVQAEEWKAYAEKFKDLCIDKGLNIDPTVSADLARVLRCPDTLNYKTEPASPTNVIDDIVVYDYNMFKEFLGEVTIEQSIESILQSIPKGLTEEEKTMYKTDNFEANFTEIVMKSFKENGCGQIRYILENAETLSEPIWYSGLSIARHCVDGDEAIHKMSEGHPGYDREATIRKANATQGKPHSCETFNSVNPGICDKCPHRGKITNPLALGKVFKIARAVEHTTSNEVSINGTILPQVKRGLSGLPKELSPFAYGLNGGIYYQPPTTFDDDGQPLPAKPPVLVSPYDIWPLKRIYSTTDGECLLMKAILPNDPDREFILPMKHVYALEKFKEIITSIGIYPDPNTKQGAYLMSYIINWGQYLVAKQPAEIMRLQMGWTPDQEAFVIGDKEITKDGRILSSPTSALCKGISKD